MSRDVVTSNTERETGSLSAAAGAGGRGCANSAAEPDIIDRARMSVRRVRTSSGRVVMTVEGSAAASARWRCGGVRWTVERATDARAEALALAEASEEYQTGGVMLAPISV